MARSGVWDTSAGQEIARQTGLPANVVPTFSSNGRILAFSCDGEIRLWELATGDVQTFPTAHIRASSFAGSSRATGRCSPAEEKTAASGYGTRIRGAP